MCRPIPQKGEEMHGEVDGRQFGRPDAVGVSARLVNLS
jgi:hypothetical protein